MSRSYVSANILFCDAEVGRSHNYINKIFLYQPATVRALSRSPSRSQVQTTHIPPPLNCTKNFNIVIQGCKLHTTSLQPIRSSLKQFLIQT